MGPLQTAAKCSGHAAPAGLTGSGISAEPAPPPSLPPVPQINIERLAGVGGLLEQYCRGLPAFYTKPLQQNGVFLFPLQSQEAASRRITPKPAITAHLPQVWDKEGCHPNRCQGTGNCQGMEAGSRERCYCDRGKGMKKNKVT